MKGKNLLTLLGSICLALILVMLPLMAACKAEEVEEKEEVKPGAEIPTVTIVSNTASPSTLVDEVIKRELMEKWDEMTPNLKIISEPHYGAELYTGAEAMTALATGALQRGAAPYSYAGAAFEPRCEIWMIPAFFENIEQMNQFHASPAWQKVLKDVEERGIKEIIPACGYWTMWLTFMEKEVRCLEDLAGLRMRCMESPLMIRSLELLGANPITVITSELTIAMQTGMMDGLFLGLSPSIIRQLGYLDYVTTCLNWPATNSIMMAMAFNTDFWNSLPQDARDAFESLVPDFVAEENDVCIARVGEAKEMVVQGTKTMTFLTPEEDARWHKALEPLIDEMRQKEGMGEIVDAALRAVGRL